MDQWLFISRVSFDGDEDETNYHIENKHSNGTTEAVDISSANAFAEEDTVMIEVLDAHLTIFAMFHVIFYIHVAFYTI